MTFDPLWLAIALILSLIGWGMFVANRWLARARITAGRPWVPGALAALPATVYALVVGRFLVEVLIDPTSNTLWPLMVAFLLIAWAFYALALRIFLWMLGRLFRERLAGAGGA
jgi:hypothetical protein